jgi:magnesium transporter
VRTTYFVKNVEESIGATLPTLGALSEIETSSRLRSRDGILYMSTPSAAQRPEGAPTAPPLGFVLSTSRLVTVRFMPLPSFDAVANKFAPGHDAPKSSLGVFALLCEEIVDHVADILEHLAGELNVLSIDAFRSEDIRGRHAAKANHILRVQLCQVGRLGDRFSEVRDGLQGLGRIVAYTEQYACEWSGGALKSRLAALRQDIHSLIDYEEQLSGKVQFVLDALVGLIGIAQNDVFKILTIVSIVGHPTDPSSGNLRHELQEHAGIRLGLGLSIWLDADFAQRPHSLDLVQGDRLVLVTDRRKQGHGGLRLIRAAVSPRSALPPTSPKISNRAAYNGRPSVTPAADQGCRYSMDFPPRWS